MTSFLKILMNNLYAVGFAPGFEDLVAKIISRIPAELTLLEDGFAIVKLNNPEDLAKLKFAKTIYQIFDYEKDLNLLEFKIPERKELSLSLGSKTFNLRFFKDREPSSLNQDLRESLISRISKNVELKYSAFEPDEDFVILQRQSGLSVFGVKLKSGAPKVQSGEIHEDVAVLLAEFADLAKLKGSDILDAFAGYGGISSAILKFYNPESLTLVEKESALVNSLKLKFKDFSNSKVVASDVANFLNKTEQKFDVIFADPPWGNYDKGVDVSKLYANFLNAARFKLKAGGRIVIISSAKKELLSAVEDSGLKIDEKLDVLISGKKVLCAKLKL